MSDRELEAEANLIVNIDGEKYVLYSAYEKCKTNCTRQPEQELVEALRKFACEVIKAECWGFALDGLDIQDLAEKLGLIAPHIATDDDVNEESDFGAGDRIYQFSELLTKYKGNSKFARLNNTGKVTF